MRILFIWLLATYGFASGHVACHGQVLGYESFAGMPLGNGVAGTGSDAAGWIDSGWSSGSDSRFQVVDAIPNLNYQTSDGVLIQGGDRALQLSTAPEPVPGVLVASRTIAGQNTTVYFSFLVRPILVGTGSDGMGLRFGFSSGTFASVFLKPDQSGNSMYVSVSVPNGSGGYTTQPLNAGLTYLIVGRLTRPTLTTVRLEFSVNPPPSYTGDGVGMSGTLSSSAVLSTIGFGISSVDSGGPSSSIIVDQLRVGFTLPDVLPRPPPPLIVPNLGISPAVKLSWQSQLGKTYQVQSSYDFTTWSNLGSAISGDGQSKFFFDSPDLDAKKYYRVQVR